MATVILAGARTPIGKLGGALAGFSGTDLGALAISSALERSGVAADRVDYVVMGQVLTAGEGQATARQAATKAGISLTTPAATVNKVNKPIWPPPSMTIGLGCFVSNAYILCRKISFAAI